MCTLKFVGVLFNSMTHFDLTSALETLRLATDFPAASQVLHQIGDLLKMPRVSWISELSPSQSTVNSQQAEIIAKESGWPEAFTTEWNNRNYTAKSRLLIQCRFEHTPFVLTVDEINSPAEQQDRDDRKMVQSVRDLGIESILVMPVHLPRSQIAVICWMGKQPADVIRQQLPFYEAQLIAVSHLFARIALLSEKTDVPAQDYARLTHREQECLGLAAQGHPDNEISTMINISATTVRFHIDNAVIKLGAVSRTHAVALAAQLGMLGVVGR